MLKSSTDEGSCQFHPVAAEEIAGQHHQHNQALQNESDGRRKSGSALHGICAHRHAAVQYGRRDNRQRVELRQQRDDDAGETDSTADPIHQAMLLAQHLDCSGQSTQTTGKKSRKQQAEAYVDTAIAGGDGLSPLTISS